MPPLPIELARRIITLSGDLPTTIATELLYAGFPKPFWITIRPSRDAVEPLLPSSWQHLHPSAFPSTLSLTSSTNFIIGDPATLPAFVLAWLARFRPTLVTYAFVVSTARAGRLDLLRLLHGFGVDRFSMGVMDAAAAEGHLDVVRFLHAVRDEGCTSEAMDAAAVYGHLEVVRFLFEHRDEGCKDGVLRRACANGHMEIVEFLQRTAGYEPDEVAWEASCDAPNLNVDQLRWLHETMGWSIGLRTLHSVLRHRDARAEDLAYCLDKAGYPYIDPTVLAGVFSANDVGMLKLVNEVFCGDAFARMWGSGNLDRLAGWGKLEALRYLYAQRGEEWEGCTPAAFGLAAEGGHVEVVEFLLGMGVEPRPGLLDILAAGLVGGDRAVELLRCLRAAGSFTGGWPPALAQKAAGAAKFTVFKYFWSELGLRPPALQLWPDECDCREVVQIGLLAMDDGLVFSQETLAGLLRVACAHGTLEEVMLLDGATSVKCPGAFRAARERGRDDVLEYLRSTRPGEEPEGNEEEEFAQNAVEGVEEERFDMHALLNAVLWSDSSLDDIKRLTKNLPPGRYLDETLEDFVIENMQDLEIFEHLLSRCSPTVSFATNFANLDVAHILIEQHATVLDPDSVRAALLKRTWDTSRFDVAKYLLGTPFCTGWKVPLNELIDTDLPDLVRHALTHDLYVDPEGSLDHAAHRNHSGDFPIFVEIYRHFPDQVSTETARQAARNPHTEILRFLSQHAPHVFDHTVMTAAIEAAAPVSTIELLLTHHPGCLLPDTHLAMAADAGGDRETRLERLNAIANALWRRWTGGCPIAAMVQAARNGNPWLVALFLERMDPGDPAWAFAVKRCLEAVRDGGERLESEIGGRYCFAEEPMSLAEGMQVVERRLKAAKVAIEAGKKSAE
ncbi:hypothetical protein HDU96_006027 [Phlyctochytrium bullatum]|nr:hypothetical protein HDU96_006027 [Phlyctochytrium bullatum]